MTVVYSTQCLPLLISFSSTYFLNPSDATLSGMFSEDPEFESSPS